MTLEEAQKWIKATYTTMNAYSKYGGGKYGDEICTALIMGKEALYSLRAMQDKFASNINCCKSDTTREICKVYKDGIDVIIKEIENGTDVCRND